MAEPETRTTPGNTIIYVDMPPTDAITIGSPGPLWDAGWAACHEQCCQPLKAENQRLRAALEEAINRVGPPPMWYCPKCGHRWPKESGEVTP